jgi:hypothetical protein
MAVAAFVAMTALVARADDCPNKWNEPKEVTGKGPKKADAITDFEKKSKTLANDANCKGNKCAKGKGKCRALRTATQSCTGDDENGWTCTGNVRVGCFCLDPKETGKIAPSPKKPPAVTETECPNKFSDPKDANGVSDQSEAAAKTLRDNKIKITSTQTRSSARSRNAPSRKKHAGSTTRSRCRTSPMNVRKVPVRTTLDGPVRPSTVVDAFALTPAKKYWRW